jgi:hypothetical protein
MVVVVTILVLHNVQQIVPVILESVEMAVVQILLVIQIFLVVVMAQYVQTVVATQYVYVMVTIVLMIVRLMEFINF